MEIGKYGLYELSLGYIPYNLPHFGEIFSIYLQNQDKIDLVNVHDKSINKLFAYGIRYNNTNILNWCLFYVRKTPSQKLYITDTITRIITKYATKKTVEWLIENECDHIVLDCDISNYNGDKMDKILHYIERIDFLICNMR